MNPENEPLLEAINTVLAAMIEDGTYAQIHANYPDLPPGGSVADAS